MYFSQILNQSGSLRPRSNSRGSSRQEKVPITIIRVAPYIYKDSLSIWILQSAGYSAFVCVSKEAALFMIRNSLLLFSNVLLPASRQ